ncbi:hypothetical protein VKT23_010086 [Stygiomarasmius scandens]|uniref:Uncharacterized protein n=1 Tax=Marasmiellus scandens TaxID=2682957 RepID=A0ABR1JDU5_9AGAR
MPGKRGRPPKYLTDEERKAARQKVAHDYHIRRGKSLRKLRRELKALMGTAEKKQEKKKEFPPSSPLPTSPPPLASTSLPPSSPPKSPIASASALTTLPVRYRNQVQNDLHFQKKTETNHLAALSGYRWPRMKFINVSSDSESELPHTTKKIKSHIRACSPEDNSLPMASSVENSPK